MQPQAVLQTQYLLLIRFRAGCNLREQQQSVQQQYAANAPAQPNQLRRLLQQAVSARVDNRSW